jgi:hypothetical protein
VLHVVLFQCVKNTKEEVTDNLKKIKDDQPHGCFAIPKPAFNMMVTAKMVRQLKKNRKKKRIEAKRRERRKKFRQKRISRGMIGKKRFRIKSNLKEIRLRRKLKNLQPQDNVVKVEKV